MVQPNCLDGNPLVSLHEGEPITTSLAIAEGSGVRHKNVLELIRNHMKDFRKFGMVAFETRPRPEGTHGGGDTEYAILNQEQTTLLFTYMRNTVVVREFKMRLVEAFFALARQSRQSSAAPSLDSRKLDTLQTTMDHMLAVLIPKAQAQDILVESGCHPADRKINSRNTSGCSGVTECWTRDGFLRWQARITVNRKVICLGVFDRLDDAVEARQAAELLYWGRNHRGQQGQAAGLPVVPLRSTRSA